MQMPKVMQRAMKYSRDWQETKMKYKNRAIEPYALSLWHHSFDLAILREYLPVLQDYNNRSVLLMEELKSLMELIVEANTGAIHGQKFTISEVDNLNCFRDNAEMQLRKRIEEFDPRELMFMWFDLTPQHIVDAWEECCLNKIPVIEEIECHNDGHFDNDSLRHHISVLEEAIEKTKALPLYSDEQLPLDFLIYAKRIGVPMTNAAYRDLYDFMLEIDAIPAEIVQSHKANTRKYVRENYIKAIYKHNPWMNDYPPLENITEEDLDKMDNEKNK